MNQHDHQHDVDGGLSLDLPRLLNRRSALMVFGGAVLAACTKDSTTAATSTTPSQQSSVSEPSAAPSSSAAAPVPSADTAASSPVSDSTCSVIPDETAGPFPGDGTNGPNVLAESGVVRRNITTSIGSASGTADGIPLVIRFKIIDTATGCAPIENAAVYAWHCTRDGAYSMYSPGFEDENYLRGLQPSDVDGVVEFDSIFPGCYQGRWPHVHFEVYPSLDAATGQTGYIKSSQIAFPAENSKAVYAVAGYEASSGNFGGLSLERDMVFGDDGGISQVGTISGDVASGMTIELVVGVDSTTTPTMDGGGGR